MSNLYTTDRITTLANGIKDVSPKFSATSYVRSHLTDEQVSNAMSASGLVSRVVRIPAEDATSKWRNWQLEDDQAAKIDDVEKNLGIRKKVRQAYSDARAYGEGFIYIDNGENPEEELNPETSAPIRFVVKLARWQVTSGEISYDPMSPQYGFPKHYDLTTDSELIVRIHPSRICHFIGDDPIMNSVSSRVGASVLEPILEKMLSYDVVLLNIAEMTMEAKVDVMKINGLLEKVRDPEELDHVQRKLRLAMETKRTAGALIMDSDEEDWEQKVMNFSTLPAIVETFERAAAGDARIPRSRLFGVQTSGLGNAGSSDDVDYYDYIKSLQENKISPPMAILDKMIVKTALGTSGGEAYEWASLYQMDDLEKAEIGDKIIAKYERAVRAGIFPSELAYEQCVNELVEAGVASGLNQVAAKWEGYDGDEEENDEF